MKNLVYIEIYKLFKSSRTNMTFAIAIMLMLIINLGLYQDGEDLLRFFLQSLDPYFFIEGKILNGFLIAYLSLNTLWVHIPILIIIVTAHIFSSEFEYGTIKILLTQPISRNQLLGSKTITMVIYIIAFMSVVGVFALFPAIIIFGKGDTIVFIDGVQFIQESTFLKRYLATIIFSSLAMFAYASMSMYFALWYKNTLSAILTCFAILIVFTLLQTFVVGAQSILQVFLFTYHIAKWQLLFTNQIPISSILNSILFLLGMGFGFVLLSFYKFNRMVIS